MKNIPGNIRPRRRFCAAVLGTALLPRLGLASAGSRATLTLAGPGAVVSYPLMHMAATGALAGQASQVRFRLWHSVDQLRVLLVNGEIDFSAVPSPLPAMLCNRGLPVRLLNISAWGIQYLVSRNPAVQSFADLAGRELAAPFQRDMPDVLLDTLLEAQTARGLAPVKLRRAGNSLDTIALMLNGQVEQTLLVEPIASLLLWRAQQQAGAPVLYRGQSMEQAWRAAFPGQPALPQAGVMAAAGVASDAALCLAVDTAYAASARWCMDHPAECAALVREHLPHMPQAALEAAIVQTHLRSRSARQARPEIEAFYQLMVNRYPQIIGGALPPASFYGP